MGRVSAHAGEAAPPAAFSGLLRGASLAQRPEEGVYRKHGQPVSPGDAPGQPGPCKGLHDPGRPDPWRGGPLLPEEHGRLGADGDTLPSHPRAGGEAAGGRGAAGPREEESCVRVCGHLCALEGEGSVQGAKAGEEPSTEKAAIVSAEAAAPGAAQEQLKSSLLCVCGRAQKKGGRLRWREWGWRGTRRGERSTEKTGQGLLAPPGACTCASPPTLQRLIEHLLQASALLGAGVEAGTGHTVPPSFWGAGILEANSQNHEWVEFKISSGKSEGNVYRSEHQGRECGRCRDVI